jgi:hypothetical protein
MGGTKPRSVRVPAVRSATCGPIIRRSGYAKSNPMNPAQHPTTVLVRFDFQHAGRGVRGQEVGLPAPREQPVAGDQIPQHVTPSLHLFVSRNL